MATHPEQKPLEIGNQSSEWVVTDDSHGNSSLPLDVNDSGKEPIQNAGDNGESTLSQVVVISDSNQSSNTITTAASSTLCQDTNTTPNSSESDSTNTSERASGFEEKQVDDVATLPLTTDKDVVADETIIDIPEHDAHVINILLIGRSQVGKSTLIESLTNPTYSSSKTGISQTREPTYKQLKMTSDDGTEYTVNIIDTPGLREIRNDPNETRTDEQLLHLLKKVFDDGQIRDLNIIGFVSVMGKTYQDDIDTFKSLIDFFGPRFKSISALILTHCDKISNEKIQELTDELKNHPKCKEAVSYCELGVHHHGTLDIDDLETFEDTNIRDRISEQGLSHLRPFRNAFKKFLLSQSNHYQKITMDDFTRFREFVDNGQPNTSSNFFWKLSPWVSSPIPFKDWCSIL